MRYLYSLATLMLLVLLQGTLLPLAVPWLPLNPALLFLVFLSFRLQQRSQFLAAALWAGLVQDILFGEILGLFMLTSFIAAAVIWELKEGFLDNPVLTCGLRLIIATLIQELLIAFIFYIRGLEPNNLGHVLQVQAGLSLAGNLLLYFLVLAWLGLGGSQRIAAALEAKE